MSTHDESVDEAESTPEVRRKITQAVSGEGLLTVEQLLTLCQTLPPKASVVEMSTKAIRTKPEWRVAVEYEVEA